MCVVSMVSDHYFGKYSQPTQWAWPTWDEYQELKRKAAEYDKLTNQPSCEKGDLDSREHAVHDYLTSTSVPRNGVGYVLPGQLVALAQIKRDDLDY